MGAGLAVWAFLLLAMGLLWGFPPHNGLLADSDDYLRMVRVFDFIDSKGAPSWLQPRLGPGGSVENGWSRLLDVPLAALLLFFQLFASRDMAALWTVTVFPALALLAALFAALWYARGVGIRPAWPALLAVVLMWDMLHQFMPGRVTHHDWQVVLVIASYAALARLCREPDNMRWPTLAGILFGTGLAIGADIVPWFALGVALVGLHFVVHGAVYERAAQRLGLAATMTGLAWFILLVHPDRFFVVQCDTISPTYVSFALAVFVFWRAVALAPASWKASFDCRLGLCTVLTLLIGGALYELWPGCFHDIYGITDPLVREFWLGRVLEAQSVLKVARGSPLFVVCMLAPVTLGPIGALWAARAERDARIWWLGLALVLACGVALAFWQFRTLDYVQAISIAPLAWLLAALVNWFAGLDARKRLNAEGAFLAIAAFCVILAVSLPVKKSSVPDLRRMREKCSIRDAALALNKLKAPQMVAAFVEEGSEIMYRTPHIALAGPYHRDQEGIGAVYRLFTAPDEKSAHKIAEKYNVGVLLACPAQRDFWDDMTGGKPRFAQQLLDGKTPPWLTRIGSPGAMRIYKVKR